MGTTHKRQWVRRSSSPLSLRALGRRHTADHGGLREGEGEEDGEHLGFSHFKRVAHSFVSQNANTKLARSYRKSNEGDGKEPIPSREMKEKEKHRNRE